MNTAKIIIRVNRFHKVRTKFYAKVQFRADDGSTEEQGNFYGNTRAELKELCLRYLALAGYAEEQITTSPEI